MGGRAGGRTRSRSGGAAAATKACLLGSAAVAAIASGVSSLFDDNDTQGDFNTSFFLILCKFKLQNGLRCKYNGQCVPTGLKHTKDAKLCTTTAYPVAVPASSPTPRG